LESNARSSGRPEAGFARFWFPRRYAHRPPLNAIVRRPGEFRDDYKVVLNNPVFFSGHIVIYLMKPTARFYWSEFAYSSVLKADEAHVRFGRLELKSR